MKVNVKNVGRPSLWIELQRSPDNERNRQCAAYLNSVLEKLAQPEDLPLSSKFSWSEHEQRYHFGGPMGYRSLSDDGEWFDLEYLAVK